MKPRISWLALMLLLTGPGVAAQTTYKSTMPDGKVVYGEKPMPGAKRVETMAAPPAKTGTTIVTPAEKSTVDQRIGKPSATEGAAQRQLDEARLQLQQAEAAFAGGKEPLPGERIGTAGGSSRLTDDYFKRQKRLEQAVESARKSLEQAQQTAR